jgi:hypothetical protein
VDVFPFCYKWNIRSVDQGELHRTPPNICASSSHYQQINGVNWRRLCQRDFRFGRATFKLVTPMS